MYQRIYSEPEREFAQINGIESNEKQRTISKTKTQTHNEKERKKTKTETIGCAHCTDEND